jgi:hypothetical protein
VCMKSACSTQSTRSLHFLGASVVDTVTRRVQAWGMTFVTRTISALRAIFLPIGLARVVLWLGIGILLSPHAFAQYPVIKHSDSNSSLLKLPA